MSGQEDRQTVLVVEDSNLIAKRVAQRLQSEGYAVETAGSGDAALQAVANERPRLMLLDYELPDMNGLELVRALERNDMEVPFVVTTGNGNEAVAVEFMKQGALDYVIKGGAFLDMVPPVVKRALQQVAADESLKRAEERLREQNRKLAQAVKQLQAAREQLVQSEKLASIGQLAAGIAHEINNPIGYIRSNLGTLDDYAAVLVRVIKLYETIAAGAENAAEAKAELARLREAEDLSFVLDDMGSLIRESLEGTERVQEIVQNLKSFAHVDETQEKEADINECLEATLKIVWNELKYKAAVEKDLQPLPPVVCRPGQLNQVFMNILVNAAQAIAERGEIHLASRAEDGEILVSVADTGKGIPAEELPKVFDPFFTTKEEGQGTGLGLSISHGIVAQHGGRIDVASTPGEGTTFTVRLPVRQTVAAGEEAPL